MRKKPNATFILVGNASGDPGWNYATYSCDDCWGRGESTRVETQYFQKQPPDQRRLFCEKCDAYLDRFTHD